MPTDLPLGTVTFLFTDIEGSTRLLEALGDTRYAELLATHSHLITWSVTAVGGVVVDEQGDAFFGAFPRAREALLAAADAQRRLHTQTWPGDVGVLVRMGLHTGPAVVENGRYVGLDVAHRGAHLRGGPRRPDTGVRDDPVADPGPPA